MCAMNTRHWALRKLESAKGNIDWAGGHLHEVMETYKPYHPEISLYISGVLDLLLLADEMVTKIKEQI
jgi:hypothetical protein